LEGIRFKYMCKNDCVADVEFDSKKVKVINYTDDIINRPFGLNESPDLEDLEYFLESRCFPRSRANCKQLLRDLGLHCYDPLSICLITHGRQWDDYNWLLFEGEVLDYERDIKLRD